MQALLGRRKHAFFCCVRVCASLRGRMYTFLCLPALLVRRMYTLLQRVASLGRRMYALCLPTLLGCKYMFMCAGASGLQNT